MVFSVCMLTDKVRGLWKIPDGRDWLCGNLGLALMGGAMLSKSLIQFSVDGWGCVPSLLFGLRTNYGRGNEGSILSPCLFNLYAECIMWNARLDEAQAGFKTVRRNTNNLRYADATILMAESEEELKSFLMKLKEESEKVGLKLNLQKMKIMSSSPITSWKIDGETVETVIDFILLGSKITLIGDCSHEIKRHLLLGRKAMTNLVSRPRHQRYDFSSGHVWMWEFYHK